MSVRSIQMDIKTDLYWSSIAGYGSSRAFVALKKIKLCTENVVIYMENVVILSLSLM